ncbi:MAG: leucine-rich repeat domain-containing protein [Simkaniaceae bacterium]|nr:leucine-rich repeat domain-containing protein [Simkaniaceae bacterium]
MTNPTISIGSFPSEVQQRILEYVGNPVTASVSKLFKEQTDAVVNRELLRVWVHLDHGKDIKLESIKEIYSQMLRIAPENTTPYLPLISLEKFLELEAAIKIRDTLTFWKNLPGGEDHIAQQNFQGLSLADIKALLTTWLDANPDAKNMTHLKLTGLGLRYLPSEIGQLRNLQSLMASENQLSSLPVEIGHLGDLWRLDLNRNQLTYLPPEIGQLRKLQNLFLSRNRLTSLPETFANSNISIGISPVLYHRIKAKMAYQFIKLRPEQKDAVYRRIYALSLEDGESIEECVLSYGENHVFESEARLERVMKEMEGR